MKQLVLLVISFVSCLAPLQAHTIYISTTESTRAEQAVVTLTSYDDKDTIRETLSWKTEQIIYMETLKRHYPKFEISITCEGYNPIRYCDVEDNGNYKFILGKTGTKYLPLSRGMVPYIPHPNELYVIYHPKKIKALYTVFDRLKVRYPKPGSGVAVAPSPVGLNPYREALWLVKYHIPIKAKNSSLLEGLRKADSVIYEVGPVIEIFDGYTKTFRRVMLTQNFYTEKNSAASYTEYGKWEAQGMQMQKDKGYGDTEWKAPAGWGMGIIDFLMELNTTFYMSSAIQYTDRWNYSDALTPDSGK